MKNSVKGILKTCVALGLCAVLAVGGYHLYKHWDKVTDWFNGIFHKEDPVPDKPTQPEGEEIKDFTFSSNQITGYIGSEVVLDNLPTSYSMKVGEVEETLEITVEDTSDEDAMKEFTEKVENSSFWCTPNGGERFFSSTFNEWNEYMASHYPNAEQEVFPMKFEFCSVTYLTGDDIKVTKIADGAFAGNTILSKVVIPRNIQELGQQAFENCENLTEINIPEGITEIKYQTFYGCKNLENIALPDSLTSIGHGAFDLTAIKSLTIPANVSNLDMLVSDKSALEELQIKSTLINPEQITSLASFASKLKIYVPDDYYLANYDIYFSNYLENIYPENGTYPENSSITVIFKNGDNEISNETYFKNSTVKVPEEPTQEGKLFCGWEIDGVIYENYQIENILIENDKLSETITFTAHFYDIPKPLEEFNSNGEIRNDIETLTLSPKYYKIQKYTNIATYNSKEELEQARELYDGKYFVHKNPDGGYNYIGVIDLDSYLDEFTYPITCSSIEISIYDLKDLTEDEINDFLSRNYYFTEEEDYLGSDYVEFTYSNFNGFFYYAENLKTIIIPEGAVLYDYTLSDCPSLEKLILDSPTLIPVGKADSLEFEQANELILSDRYLIYVPDELVEEYKSNELYSPYADQIHPMSELELAEG